MSLNLTSKYVRAGLVVSAAWLLLAGSLYFGGLGGIITMSYEPAWYSAWERVFPFSSMIPVYDLDCGAMTDIMHPPPCTTGLSVLGLATFLLFPVAIVWAVGYAMTWIKRGTS